MIARIGHLMSKSRKQIGAAIGNFLLQENGFYLLQEDGFYIILE